MIVIRLDSPTEYSCGEYTPEDASQYELEDIRNRGFDAVVYWYSAGYYEGTGYALLRHSGKWLLQSCGHCSCYGPFSDGNSPSVPSQTLEEAESLRSAELKAQTDHLFAEAKKL